MIPLEVGILGALAILSVCSAFIFALLESAFATRSDSGWCKAVYISVVSLIADLGAIGIYYVIVNIGGLK